MVKHTHGLISLWANGGTPAKKQHCSAKLNQLSWHDVVDLYVFTDICMFLDVLNPGGYLVEVSGGELKWWEKAE